jgi:hypothetical protein
MANAINPYATTLDALAMEINALTDDNSAEGAMWRHRAVAMLSGVKTALEYKGENGI